MKLGGIITLKIDSELIRAKGEFEYNLGIPKNEAVQGTDGLPHGYTEAGQIPMIKGSITITPTMKTEKILKTKDATVTLDLNNGKTIVGRNMWISTDGNVKAKDGEMEVLFQSAKKLEEVR